MSRHPLRRSVRLRLTLWYGAALTLALLLYAGLVAGLLRHELSRELDRQLAADLKLAPAMLERGQDGRIGWDEDVEEGGGQRSNAPRPWIEVLDRKGGVLFRSPELIRGKRDGPLRWRDDDAILDGDKVTVRAARPTAPLHKTLLDLGLVLALGLPLAVGLAAGGGWLLARRALSIGQMAERACSITAERLSERLAVDNPADELGQLAAVFNQTLERLERSFDQLRRFTADASHELRTPLTAIRSVGEVGLGESRTPEEYREIVGSMLEETDRLARLIDSLLMLSRADAGQVRLTREPTELAALAEAVVRQVEVLAEEKGQRLALETPTPVTADVDRLVLRQALLNLIDNAIRYSPAGGAIRVSVAAEEGRAVIAVRDQGPGIAPEDAARIFDRFYRVDKNRSRQEGGVGLGLSIARWAVEAHGGRIELTSAPGQGSQFRIVIPHP